MFLDEYNEQQKKIELAIRKKELIVDDIVIYNDLKIKLNHLIKHYSNMIDIIGENESGAEGLICPLWYYLRNSKSTFLSPAIFLNKYIDVLTEYTKKYLSGEAKFEDYELFEIESTINIQNIFISIKCSLDRLVPIFSFYYKGISLTTTFGRIKENNKSSGLMGRAIQDKENDELFKYIYEQYNEWIKFIIIPRDVVMHYNDMETRLQQTLDGRIFILHKENKIFNNENEDLLEPNEHYYKSIAIEVNRIYEFYRSLFGYLKDRNIIYTKHHFKNEKFYYEYSNTQNLKTSNLEKALRITCKICGRKPEEIPEYINNAEEMTPAKFVIENEGTFDKATGKFICTECYINEQIAGNIR